MTVKNFEAGYQDRLAAELQAHGATAQARLMQDWDKEAEEQ